MATRGNIGILNEDGSVTGIYVHFDAYPEYVGKILVNHYNNADIVMELMELGDLSTLAENMYCDDNSHCWDNPVDGVCVAYGRDRGEKNMDARVFNNIEEYKNRGHRVWADFQYLFNNGKWMYRSCNSNWSELTGGVCKCD
jgi:hypothetical protein